MAGVGFELKKLFGKHGILNRLKAYTYSSSVIVGPMLFCMLMILVIQIMMTHFSISYHSRQLFISGVIYAFIFSYLLTSIFNMLLTRNIADLIYTRQYHEILPSLYRTLHLLLPLAALIGFLFILSIPIAWDLKLSFYIFYMELTLIWTLSIYISTVKEYKKITFAFFIGVITAVLGTFIVLQFTPYQYVTSIVIVLDIGLMITAALLWLHIEKLFYSPKPTQSTHSFYHYFSRYPSLLFIGFLGALGLFSHQFIEWVGPNGIWLDHSFLLAPRYDIAVYYAFLSIIPTLVIFVVNFETEFYIAYKKYYDLVFEQGNLTEINEARNGMVKVLMREISRTMGIQLFFSMLCITLGYRLLPMIGFTNAQIATFTILVMGFYLYITYVVLTVVLLYFDDRKGTLWLTVLFLLLCIMLSILFLFVDQQGLSLFLTSFITVVIAFARLLHILRHLHYYTFSAQPLATKKETLIEGADE